MPDRLRELLDLVVASVDDPGTDGRALAERAHFSRDHLDRLLAAATGETAVALRRRLLLERAAWQLRRGGASASEAARAAGYGSLAAFSRAFARAYGSPPSAFASALSGAVPIALDAPNGIHFHAPAGLLLPDAPRPTGTPAARDPSARMLAHHVVRTRQLLRLAQDLDAARLDHRARPGLVIVWLDGEEATARLMEMRLVQTLEVWVAALAGEPLPETAGHADLPARFDHAARAFTRIVRRLAERGAWDHAFIDTLCEPPQSFTYGGVVAHVLSYGAARREALAGVLSDLGVAVPALDGDPLAWEARAVP